MAYFNRYRGDKYGNKKIGGYDSKAEMKRGKELELLEAAGEICNLQRQVKFVLLPTQREPDTIGARGGKIKGKLIEKECSYYADFTYTDKNGDFVVEDVKGEETEVFKIKRKMMLYFHGIRVRTVKGGRK